MKRNKIISALLCAALLLSTAGCAKAQGGAGSQATGISAASTPQGAMGRWVEEKIDLGKPCELLSAPVQLTDGTLRMYARDAMEQEELLTQGSTVFQLDSTDDGITWQESATAINDTEANFISRLHIAPNGGVLMIGLALGEGRGNNKSGLYYTAPGGTPQPVLFDTQSPLLQNDAAHPEGSSTAGTKLEPLFEGQLQISQFGFLSDTLAYGTIAPGFSSDGSEEFTLDLTILFEPATGKIVAKVDTGKGYSTGNLTAQAANASGLSHLTREESGNYNLYSVDTAGASTLRIEGIQAPYSSSAYLDEQGNYFFINTGGIYSITAGGTLAELVVDSAGFTISSEDKIIWDHNFTRASDGSFFVAMQALDSMESELYRYRFDITLPAVNENSISVWSLRDNATLRAALVAFRQTNNDVTVNYTVGMPEDAQGLNQEDVLRALNTQILAGNGPDVMVLDSVDASAYANKGLLLDLSAQVDGAALTPFVKNAYYKPGETYVLPARFTLPVVMGPADKIGALTTLASLQEAILACAPRPVMDGTMEQYYAELPANEMYGMGFHSVAQLTQFALQTSASALLADGKVDAAALKQVLGFIEAVGKHSDMASYLPTFHSNGATGGGNGDPITWLDGGYEFSTTNNAVYGWDAITTPGYLSCTGQQDRTTDTFRAIGFAAQPGLVSGAYLPSTLLAVSAGSKQQEQALAFVKTMFSAQMQSGYYQDGMPVLQSELDASIVRNCAEERLTHYNIQTRPEAIFASLQTPVVIDAMLQQKIVTHAEALVAGRESLDEAVAAVEQELGLYLAERG